MDPKLAEKTFEENGRTYRIVVHGGLHAFKGQEPYFSITGEIWGRSKREPETCGCIHTEIEKHFPGKFTDLIAMHLSSMDGKSMHCIDNGFYFLAGAAPGHFDQMYHGANSTPEKSADDCLKIAAEHFRITFDQAKALLDSMVEVWKRCTDRIPAGLNGKDRKPHLAVCRDEARSVLFSFVNENLDRWKAEAKACIAKHNLKIFE